MNNLIYFSTTALSYYDPYLMSPEYKHNRWFKILNSIKWPWHTNSRVTKLNPPWDLVTSPFPIPEIRPIEQRFDLVIESIAEEFGRELKNSGKTAYLYWSGGLDSNSILVSILKTWNAELLEQLVILCDIRSIHENAYFYHKFIKGRLKEQVTDEFIVNETNYDKIVIVDGEAGNQCIVGPSVQRLSYRERFDLLNAPWRERKDLRELLIGSTDFNIELILESIEAAPIDLVTGYDFLWWTGFNFKFDDVLLRRMFKYCRYLTPRQTSLLWNSGIYRFYQHPDMQIWAMSTLDQRREKLPIAAKYYPKKYIYDFDRNDLYWSSKVEQGSDSLTSARDYPIYNPVFAFDQDWNSYSLADYSTRKLLGEILER